MRIAILGYGAQGKTAVEYWNHGNDITVCDFDSTITLPPGIEKQTGEGYLQNLHSFDLIVRSPAVHPRDIVAANDERILRKVTTVTEEFFRNCNAKIIGVTGTKGKGTTSTLITDILKAAGKMVHLGGNIGIPPLELLKENIKSTDYVVLELANFQLIDLRVSPAIAVCLMVVPEHLDWHKDMAEYIKAKQNLFRHQDDEDLAIFNRLSDFSTEVAEVSPALKRSYEVPAEGQKPDERNGAYVDGDTIYYDGEPVCKTSDVILLGRHNLQNVCAAITAVWDIIDGDTELLTKVIRQFHGLPHRLELVRELDGIAYYNDSFATGPGAAAAAVSAIKGNKVLIAGGYDRGLSFDPLVEEIKARGDEVKQILLIGTCGPRMAETFTAAGIERLTVTDSKDIREILDQARSFAQEGDSIVLSPGAASFDMFKNFEDRGIQFKHAVNAL